MFAPASKKENCPECKCIVIRSVCYGCGWCEVDEPAVDEWPSVEDFLEPHEILELRKKKKKKVRRATLKKPSVPDFSFVADSRIEKFRKGIID